NQGTSPTEDATLFDQVYLSDKPTLDAPGARLFDQVYLSDKPTLDAPGARQWFLGTVEHDGVVASGGSYSAQATFQLSPEISPPSPEIPGRYVIVDTNRGGAIGDTIIPPPWEGPYTDNNAASAATHVTPRPPADLRVTSVVGQAPNYSGEETTIQWTVKNFGA